MRLHWSRIVVFLISCLSPVMGASADDLPCGCFFNAQASPVSDQMFYSDEEHVATENTATVFVTEETKAFDFTTANDSTRYSITLWEENEFSLRFVYRSGSSNYAVKRGLEVKRGFVFTFYL